MNVLVTGASGFIGSWIMRRLASDGTHTPIASHTRLSETSDWSQELLGVEAIIHCAARVHVMREHAHDPIGAFRTVNIEGTTTLARQAAAAGVKRFIFISSIAVNGNHTAPGEPFTAADTPSPHNAYGHSKYEAERILRDIAAASTMELVIIRPPMVYGPGAKGNPMLLEKLIRRRIPLPFGAIKNLRSFVSIENLVDFVVVCLLHPAAANQVFLVSDGDDLSTPEFIRRLGCYVGKPAVLIPFPVLALRLIARVLGRPALAESLCGSLQVDINKNRELLGWAPTNNSGQYTANTLITSVI